MTEFLLFGQLFFMVMVAPWLTLYLGVFVAVAVFRVILGYWRRV